MQKASAVHDCRRGLRTVSCKRVDVHHNGKGGLCQGGGENGKENPLTGPEIRGYTRLKPEGKGAFRMRTVRNEKRYAVAVNTVNLIRGGRVSDHPKSRPV